MIASKFAVRGRRKRSRKKICLYSIDREEEEEPMFTVQRKVTVIESWKKKKEVRDKERKQRKEPLEKSKRTE